MSVQDPPTNVAAQSTSSSTIRITWDSASGALTYNLYRGIASGREAIAPVAVLITGNTYDDWDLRVGQEYFYHMTALGVVDQSAPSNETSATPEPESGGGQAPPTGVNATGGASSINLTWVAAFGATNYNLYRGLTPGGESPTPIATGLIGTGYADATVTLGVTYYYYMRAVGPAGTSIPSNETSAEAASVGNTRVTSDGTSRVTSDATERVTT